MLDFLTWYLTITALGWLVLPILYYLLPNLPGRGISFTKIFGLLLWGYLYWILGRLGITANNIAGLLFALILVVVLTYMMIRKNQLNELSEWIKEHWRLVFIIEILFLVAFAGWALVRSLNPEILGTEKPMELAFINAILRSDSFPPNDPWLSGYAISYYYFGYILIAMLAKITGTLGSVAFNLGVSLIFALSVVGSFGLLFNLLTLSRKQWESQLYPSLLAPFFTLILSNWEGFLHYLHSRGVFWGSDNTSSFWRWLDIKDLVNPPTGESFGHWWWWRASRVIQDYDYSGFGKEVISEFPFFSFLLADLHPHVLSLPFVFLVLIFSLSLFLRPKNNGFSWLRIIPIKITPAFFLILAWVAGGMAFLNTWNFPMYVGILAGAYALRNSRDQVSWKAIEVLKDLISLGFTLGITGGIMYLPWYIGFASQAGGIIPNVLYITRGSQFWVMFGPLLIPIFIWIIYTWQMKKSTRNLGVGASLSGILVMALFILMLAIVAGVSWLPFAGREDLINLFLSSVGGSSVNQVLVEGLWRRLTMSGTWITLFGLATLTLGLVFQKKSNFAELDDDCHADQFVMVLILGGMILTLVPEFIYLRDLFGYRINTIFKFYYQAWLMWSIAAAYGTILILRRAKSTPRYLIIALLGFSVLSGLFYPILGIQTKTNNFTRSEGMTLDGEYVFPATDSEGAAWLRNAPPGVIAEAVGGSYSSAARMATYSGNPTILGWDFHEIQWRGDGSLVWPRKEKVATIYCTHSWEILRPILEEFSVKYVVLGEIEYSTYQTGSEYCPGGLHIEKFNKHLVPVFQNSNLIIYMVPDLEMN